METDVFAQLGIHHWIQRMVIWGGGGGSGLALTVKTHGVRTIWNSSPESADSADQVSAIAGRNLPSTRAGWSGLREFEKTPSNHHILSFIVA